MGIARYENVDINRLTFGTDAFGEYTTTTTFWFTGRPTVHAVKNSVAILEKYRIYSDLINMKFNYTPNMKAIVDSQNLYSVNWRGNEWRITDAIESDDRMSITLMCYRSDPETKA
ncbi:hypothetical protein UFOVP263_55 [uncultured Caudovirales phage]|uniref:Bacteriophage SPP1, head-tail adaptor n=1 Tax=uncultured Caudovirales phage TaxID=2100421 RepID=A0A6J5LQH1_9CAUD|nr:hypothetical protein UFOVP263_55 [uncultured Caudovirales phage]CAB4241995.1 hypothetical protein UFOVP91_7 [uncultured Caudovirales phage]